MMQQKIPGLRSGIVPILGREKLGSSAASRCDSGSSDGMLPLGGHRLLTVERDRIVAHCGGGGRLTVINLEVDGVRVSPGEFAGRFGTSAVAIGA